MATEEPKVVTAVAAAAPAAAAASTLAPDTLAALAASAAAATAVALDPAALAAVAAADAATVDVLNWRGHALPFGHSKQLFWFQVSKSGSAVFEERYFPGGHFTQARAAIPLFSLGDLR
jgi:hypothetical protein